MNSPSPSIRLARPEDKDIIFRFTEHTWEFGDYIAEVWDHWLTEPGSRLLVLTLEEKPVALIHLVMVSPHEAWLEGLRVDPSYRRSGLATLLTRYCLQAAVSLHADTLRFLTSSLNTPVHLMANQLGFSKIVEITPFSADALAGDSSRLLTAAERDLPNIHTFLQNSPMLRAMGGLYGTGWRFLSLNDSELTRRLHQGTVWIIRTDSNIKALAIVEERNYDENLVATYIDGRPEELEVLVTGLRSRAADLNLKEVSVRLPPLPQVRSIFERLGFTPAEDHSFWIFQKTL